MTVNEYINIVDKFSLSDKLRIIEELSKKIRLGKEKMEKEKKKNLSDFFGAWTEKEASEFEKSLKDCDKIDSK